MKAPDKIYVEIRHPMPTEYTEIIGFDTPEKNTIKYIRADLAKQPETDLLEEAYMRGFAQGAKEERKDLIPLINRLCEAILFEWKDAADLARKIQAQIKAQEG